MLTQQHLKIRRPENNQALNFFLGSAPILNLFRTRRSFHIFNGQLESICRTVAAVDGKLMENHVIAYFLARNNNLFAKFLSERDQHFSVNLDCCHGNGTPIHHKAPFLIDVER
jgi:hypothetical protein